MKTVLVHDWLVTEGGAEKVLSAIWHLFPSPVYTLFCDFNKMGHLPYVQKEICFSFLQRLPWILRYHRLFFPLFPSAVEGLDLSRAELIISSSHAAAKGIIKKKEQLHICYCHTPIRYAWDLKEEYLSSFNPLAKKIAGKLLDRVRKWDRACVDRVDVFIANSHYVAERIRRCYQRESVVIYPPVAVDQFYISKTRKDYYVTHARLVAYKKIDVLVEAFNAMPDKKLVIIGKGPEEKKLKRQANSNIEFLGALTDSELASTLSQARAYVFAAQEDFGIAVVEAQSSGLAVLAFKKGGALETLVEGKTGLFFEQQTASSVMDAVNTFEQQEDLFDPIEIRKRAQRFSVERFQQEFSSFIYSCKKDFFDLKKKAVR